MIYLVHHADAVGPEVDPQRPISPAGREHVNALAQACATRGVKPAAIWHSGKLRAKQTAEAFQRACNPLAPLTAVHGLQPADPPNWMRDTLAGDDRELMIVGHMPHLARLLTLLVSGRESPALEFPLHGIVALDAQGERWVERWKLESAS
jgi:phosphohistidine phosphatase